ncbi:Uncharacterized protein GBIM_10290 [Gryllus bimaculatus]|nr:Uncharacterized protein GBIM_10290 [Gryllus bimaculatus]
MEEQALLEQRKVELRPNFRSMFSDHPRYPRLKMCMRCPDRGAAELLTWDTTHRPVQAQALVPTQAQPSAQPGAAGGARAGLFRRPVAALLAPVVPPVRLGAPPPGVPDALRGLPLNSRTPLSQTPSPRRRGPCSARHKGTQTDYREAETQTAPWQPPYEIGPGHQPEWLMREREIEANHRERMRLARLLLAEHRARADHRLETRLARAWARGERAKDRKIGQIRLKRDRELRKLSEAHQGFPRRYKRLPPIEAHADLASQLYGPLARFGADPSQRHEVIDVPCTATQRLQGLEMLEHAPPEAEPAFDFRRHALPPKPYVLCTRETRWSEQALDQLLAEMKGQRESSGAGGLGLVRRIYQESSPPSTPSQEGVSDKDEEIYQSSVFLQKIIKGRAVQCLVVKVHQEAVDVFLEDVILQTLQRTSDAEARRYELVADLLHSFLLPEVEKQRLRERHLAKQRGLLRAAHDEVFGRLLRPRRSPAEPPPLPAPPLLDFFPGADGIRTRGAARRGGAPVAAKHRFTWAIR